MDKSLPLWKQYRKEYSVWAQMLDRCRNPNHPQFKYWGGRGIRVCDEWKIFANFLEDMGSRPVGKYSLERRNRNGNYEPDNCYWATDAQQNNNTRRNIFITHNGVTQTLKQWSEELGVPYDRLHARYKYGWPTDKILTTPMNQHHKKWVSFS